MIDRKQIGKPAFTLAELLIALSILALIATFTIPKILVAQTYSKYNTAAKEVAAMVSEAYNIYRENNEVSGSTRFSDLTPYMNYVTKVTNGLIDGHQLEGNIDCSITSCLKLHGGGILRYNNTLSFGGTAGTNAMGFNFDPDGTQNGNHSVQLWLYTNGRITSVGHILPNTSSSAYTAPIPCPACDPPWFSWEQ